MSALYSLVIIIFSVYMLIIISNDYFIKSLDQISHKLKLSPSVAGATLMAAGSSAPELSIALFALFTHGGAHSDIGIGTIVGSAVFNILVITGLCAVIRTAEVTVKAIIRDTVFYLASIVVMLVVFIDGKITAYEPLLLIGLYGVYLLALYFLPGDEYQEHHIPAVDCAAIPGNIKSWKTIFYRIDCSLKSVISLLTGDAHENYIRAFTVSIFIIVVLSKLLVDNAIIFAESINLPPVIIALTILAAGTSAPDLIASIIVVRRGHGDMAISNAVGSNIFDILIGLGLPWLIRLWFTPVSGISVGTADLIESVFILIGTVLILFSLLLFNKRLARGQGIFLLLLYAGYIGWVMMAS
jgi:K+-dependent Na+/Ca+ exchanger-like protein